jgi:hypothetical protein
MGTNGLKLLAITCWCGDQSYATMTSKMLHDLVASLGITELEDWRIAMVAQGTTPNATVILPPNTRDRFSLVQRGHNDGFAVGMNKALEAGLRKMQKPDVVLCLNNDMEMPHTTWLKELLVELQADAVLCPKTNYTSVNEQRAAGPEDKPAHFHGVTPGLCWLMPFGVVQAVQEHLGDGKLFPDDLGGRAWGEDNYTAGVIRTKIRPAPFKIVPRSWIRHLGAKTSSKIPAEEKMACHKEAHKRMKEEGFK